MGDQLSIMATQPRRMSKARLLTVMAIGNALEFFDFTVFGYFAIVIGHLYFSPLSEQGQLMSSMATFGVGFVMRPLGGILFGIYADRAGRRAAMTLTLTLMMVGVCLVGLAPTYAQIGIAAPVLMVLARLIQGLSAGGEVGPATAVLLEHAPPGARGFFTSWQPASQGIGIATGAASAALLTYLLPEDQLYAWGWRIPFLIGAVILPVGIMIRRQLVEIEGDGSASAASHTAATPATPAKYPFRAILRDYSSNIAAGILLLMGATVAAYFIMFFIPTYAIRELKLGESASYAAAMVSGVVIAVVTPIVGKLSDVIGRKTPFVVARILLVALLYPMFAWLSDAPSVARLFVCVITLTTLFSVQSAPTMTLLPELFPKAIRATGTGTVYSIGVAIFGGLTQLVAVWLIQATGSRLAPAVVVTAVLAVSTLSFLSFKIAGAEDR